MAALLCARINPELRQALARYCMDHDVTQTQAVEQGLRLLLERASQRKSLTPVAAAEKLKRIRRDLQERLKGFDADRAKCEGRN